MYFYIIVKKTNHFVTEIITLSVVMASDKEEIRTQDQKLTALAKAKQDKVSNGNNILSNLDDIIAKNT